jgi:dCTP deaminase
MSLLDVVESDDVSRSEARLTKEYFVRFDENFVLHPGKFVLGITLEWLGRPARMAGYVTGKSSWGRRGLIIETAAGIHPGFKGCLTLELTNVGEVPIALQPGIRICQVFLHGVKEPGKETRGQFTGRRKPVLGRLVPDEVVKKLRGAKKR